MRLFKRPRWMPVTEHLSETGKEVDQRMECRKEMQHFFGVEEVGKAKISHLYDRVREVMMVGRIERVAFALKSHNSETHLQIKIDDCSLKNSTPSTIHLTSSRKHHVPYSLAACPPATNHPPCRR